MSLPFAILTASMNRHLSQMLRKEVVIVSKGFRGVLRCIVGSRDFICQLKLLLALLIPSMTEGNSLYALSCIVASEWARYALTEANF